MKQFKKIAISIAMMASMAVISLPASAEATGEAVVRAAAETSIAKIEEAVSLSEKKADKVEIIKAINEARQLQKEFRYELTERQRQKANDKLRIARDAFESGDLTTANAKLAEGLAGFKEMKQIYDAAHK
jgi:uncharacterized iron-regulated protein